MANHADNFTTRCFIWRKHNTAQYVLVALLLACLLGLSGAARASTDCPGQTHTMKVLFDTSQYGGDVWLQVQDPQLGATCAAFTATYGDGKRITFNKTNTTTNLMSEPVKLSDIGSGGLTIVESISAVLFLFYDDPSSDSRTAAPSVFTTTERFQQFELTMNSDIHDQGNLTNIDAFTAPLSLKSYASNATGTPSGTALQSTGYGDWTANRIAKLLLQAGATKTLPDGTVVSAIKKDASGKILRIIGPSPYNPGDALNISPWNSFTTYAKSLVGTTTTLQRGNGFGSYYFTLDATATTESTGVINVAGTVTGTLNGATVQTWDAAFSVSPSTGTNGEKDYNAAIYGQSASLLHNNSSDPAWWNVGNGAITLGDGWNNFQQFCKDTTDPGGKTLQELGAYNTTLSMAVGELTTGLIGGFFGSTHQVTYDSHLTTIGALPSAAWWQLDPLVGFSQIQSDTNNYNRYADVIWLTSNNTVYGVPFSDRFGTGPLVNTVQTANGTSVGYWVVGVGAPLGLTLTEGPDLLLLLDN